MRLTSDQPKSTIRPSQQLTVLTPSELYRSSAGFKTRRRRSHYRRALIARVVLVLMLFASVGTAALGISAYSTARQVEASVVTEFSAGQAELETGKTLLEKATKDRNPAELDQAKVHFLAARVHFQKAPDLLAHNPYLGLATYFGIPYVAPRLKAARAVATMGSALTEAALIGVDIDALLVHPTNDPNHPSGPFAVLNEVSAKVPGLKDQLVIALAAAQSVDTSLLPASQVPALEKAIGSIQKALRSVDQLGSLLPVAKEILGGNGPRSYLVLQATPAELRAGGGFIGSVSVITISAGKVTLGLSGGVEKWEYPRANIGDPGYVAPPGPLQTFIGRNSFGLADSNYYPDFVTNSKVAEQFAQSEMHIKPDGIISIDPDVVAALLNLTGPISVPGYDVTVSGSTFTEWLFQQQYALKNVNSTKKAIFSAIASVLIPQIASLPPSRWPDLMTQLNKLASERHIQVYFNNAPAESVMNDYGWSGTINPRHASDFMYEVESNFGATKANHFITRSYNVDLSVVNGQLRHIVSLHLKNSEPYFEYEGGNNYNCYLRLYLPANATGLAVTSLAQSNKIPDVSAPTGYQEIDGWFEIDVSWYWGYGQRTIRFQWDTPYDASANQQSIYWQKQPGTENDAISIAWHSGGHTYGASGVLDTDKEIVLTPSAISLIAGQAGSATVPSLSL